MTEIEKIERYVKRTKMEGHSLNVYEMNLAEAFALAIQAHEDNDLPISIINLAFTYGRAKGYRAAKAEGRARA